MTLTWVLLILFLSPVVSIGCAACLQRWHERKDKLEQEAYIASADF